MLSGWGRVYAPGREVLSEDLEALTENAVLSRGLGRSYGDSALPPPGVLDVATTVRADRILAFDDATGTMRAEAGLSLREINRLFLPRGFFTPVTPGTAFVTLGGMVAADVHGKNHHVAGCFGAHVASLRLRVADDRIVECSPEREPELFAATVGGMGLTGHILEVSFRLERVPSPWIVAEHRRIRDIDAFLRALDESAREWPFTMGWIDCLARGAGMGRGVLHRGRWAEPGQGPARSPGPRRTLAVPFELPGFLLGSPTVRLFNAAVYRNPLRPRRHVQHPEAFFYPLDSIRNWNRIYGPRGFTQYQCVLPRARGPAAVRRFLDVLTASGGASFLCVIKDCGAQGAGMLSFPLEGTSIALDMAVRENTQAIVDRLNEAVIREGGRIYLAKDGFTRAEHFRAMEPRLDRFLAVRRAWDPRMRLRSAQSVRVLGDPP
jgi:FAD/FMN-containing dehydrogenase